MTSTLREALQETLTALLSSDASIRKAAEQQVKVYEVIDDYGCHLVDFVLSPEVPWPLRQLAGVMLKQYIISHWKSEYEKHEPPEVPPAVKTRLRVTLLTALGQDCDVSVSTNKKLKSVIAYAVYAIGHYDYPEEWPELLPSLKACLSSPQNRGAVYSSMKVLAELCHDITESQVPALAPELLPIMLEMIRNPHSYDIRTRGRAVQIFTFIIETFAILEELDKKAVKTYLAPILPHFMETLVSLLQMPSVSGEQAVVFVDTGLRKEIISCLTILLKDFRSHVSKWMPSILSAVWHCLTSSAVVYVNTVVNSDSDLDGNLVAECLVDSDGEDLGQDAFIFAIFEFVSTIIEAKKTRKLIKGGMTDLLYYIIVYMQMTDEQVAVWSENPDQYVEDEDEDSYSFSVRLSAKDVLLQLMAEYEGSESPEENDAFKRSLVDALKRHFSESNHLKMSNNNSNWWKIQEACLLSLGSEISETFVEVIQNNKPPATDLKSILDNVFMGSFEGPNLSPFFVGRCLCTAARFVQIMPPPIIDRFLQVTVTAFTSESPVVKISAIRAIYSFSSNLKEMNQTDIMKPYLSNILTSLIDVGCRLGSEVLALVLETLVILASVDKEFTAAHESKFSPPAIASFLRYSSDPVIIACCQNVFKELSRNRGCVSPLQSRLGPTLLSILSPKNEDVNNQSVLTLQPAALDILATLVRSSPLPLSEVMIHLFSAAVSSILRTSEDNSSLQNGGECIRAYVSRATSQVMEYRESVDRTGSSMVMQVCLHLLDPRVQESCAAFVGKLISVTISKAASHLGVDNVNLLLRSVLSKLQTSETLSVIQSLLMVFAHLIHHDMKTVLDFLSSIPGPTGAQSALEFVLSLWLSRQHLFFGAYEKKVSLLALGKLLEYSVQQLTSSSPSSVTLNLNQIIVPGDPILPQDGRIITRSRSKEVKEWTQVPCSVKILKVLIAEIGSFQEAREDYEESDEDDEDTEEDEGHGGDDSIEDSIDDENNSNPSPTKRSGDHPFDCDDDDEEDDDSEIDPDEVTDPIREVALEDFLVSFVKSFGSTPVFGQFVQQLNEQERGTLTKIK